MLPFPHWSVADLDFDSANPNKMYKNHLGSDVTTIEVVCEVRIILLSNIVN